MCDPARRQPRQQRQQTLGRRRESPALPRRLAPGHQPHARHDRLLMHVQPGYPLMHYLHAVSSAAMPPGWGPPTKRNLTSVLRALPPLAPVRVFEAPRVQLATGLSSTKERRPLADGRTSIAPPQAFPPVSSRAGRPQAGDKLAMTGPNCHCEPAGPRSARPEDRLREAISRRGMQI